MGLGWTTSGSIIHVDRHKPNNKLVSAELEHFWCTDEPRANTDHKIHHGPNLGEATTFPLIVYFVHGHGANTQMSFCLESPKIPKIGTPTTLAAHNFVYIPPIEVRSQAKL
jgi:hypothetical protein